MMTFMPTVQPGGLDREDRPVLGWYVRDDRYEHRASWCAPQHEHAGGIVVASSCCPSQDEVNQMWRIAHARARAVATALTTALGRTGCAEHHLAGCRTPGQDPPYTPAELARQQARIAAVVRAATKAFA